MDEAEKEEFRVWQENSCGHSSAFRENAWPRAKSDRYIRWGGRALEPGSDAYREARTRRLWQRGDGRSPDGQDTRIVFNAINAVNFNNNPPCGGHRFADTTSFRTFRSIMKGAEWPLERPRGLRLFTRGKNAFYVLPQHSPWGGNHYFYERAEHKRHPSFPAPVLPYGAEPPDNLPPSSHRLMNAPPMPEEYWGRYNRANLRPTPFVVLLHPVDKSFWVVFNHLPLSQKILTPGEQRKLRRWCDECADEEEWDDCPYFDYDYNKEAFWKPIHPEVSYVAPIERLEDVAFWEELGMPPFSILRIPPLREGGRRNRAEDMAEDIGKARAQGLVGEEEEQSSHDGGGPFLEVGLGGVTMRVEATNVRPNPFKAKHQEFKDYWNKWVSEPAPGDRPRAQQIKTDRRRNRNNQWRRGRGCENVGFAERSEQEAQGYTAVFFSFFCRGTGPVEYHVCACVFAPIPFPVVPGSNIKQSIELQDDCLAVTAPVTMIRSS
ncbi:hypothetical protein G647_09405 [Cladophialophora carrionii CBS 160.54]|uniref:Uncharacterized protein n=1 Tax=Cladophialophora carrionii CBS 160.54 TaxID=1279043 RepID=V9CYW0_9EURO|nr:uncharacterized protein G647_09405 [Cladophialophora carrionii CBS 160.54]ETI19571.1 hypothetical protein G647_09405 [Cladophialophora carrionii CBS 160.54]